MSDGGLCVSNQQSPQFFTLTVRSGQEGTLLEAQGQKPGIVFKFSSWVPKKASWLLEKRQQLKMTVSELRAVFLKQQAHIIVRPRPQHYRYNPGEKVSGMIAQGTL